MTTFPMHRLRWLWPALLLVLTSLAGLPAATAGTSDPVGVWPLQPQPQVVADFDPPSEDWRPGHRGVDLLGRTSQSVRSALPGTVIFTGSIAGRGVVVVSHGDTRTTYEPVVSEVARGVAVTAGAVIGRLAVPGSHCFPRACLHWGWIRGDTYLDPLDLVGAGDVRLLPLDGLPALGPAGRWLPPITRAGALGQRPVAAGPW